MSNSTKVLVCSASPDYVNQNALLRNYVARGFVEILSAENVISCSHEFSLDAAKQFRPQLIVVFGSCMPASSEYSGLRNYCIRNDVQLVFWLHDDPYEFDYNYKIYNYADFIFTNDKWAAVHIEHPNVYHLPLAADPIAHYRSTRPNYDRDLFFCGVGFPNRRQLIADSSEFLKKFHVEIFGADWPLENKHCRNIRISNETLPDYYAGSLATLNIGRRYNLANSKYQLDSSTPGPRTFEAAMAGAVQCVHYEQPEIDDYFAIDSEILIFDTPSELAEQLVRLREDHVCRNDISNAAQKRAQNDHKYSDRAKLLLSIAMK